MIEMKKEIAGRFSAIEIASQDNVVTLVGHSRQKINQVNIKLLTRIRIKVSLGAESDPLLSIDSERTCSGNRMVTGLVNRNHTDHMALSGCNQCIGPTSQEIGPLLCHPARESGLGDDHTPTRFKGRGDGQLAGGRKNLRGEEMTLGNVSKGVTYGGLSGVQIMLSKAHKICLKMAHTVHQGV